MHFELVEPTSRLVKQYCSFWGYGNLTPQWNTELFKGVQVDIRNYIKKREFDNFKKEDECISELFNIGNYTDALINLNRVYNTRLKESEIIALANKLATSEEMTFDSFVKLCYQQTGKYTYSFATKVYSFVKKKECPSDYPIIDSNVCTLLYYYLKKRKKPVNKTEWTDYCKFKKAYKSFVDEYSLDEIPYREIDIFLWTYAKAIQKYWRDYCKDLGILSFSSVPYELAIKK